MYALGVPHPFRPKPWASLEEEYATVALTTPGFDHVLDLISSIRGSSACHELGAITSMGDLLVRPVPAPDPPVDVVAIRTPISVTRVPEDRVVIEHLSRTGHNELVERPTRETIPLF